MKNFIQERQHRHTTTTAREWTVDSVYNNFGVDSLGKFALKQEINFRHIHTVCISIICNIYIYMYVCNFMGPRHEIFTLFGFSVKRPNRSPASCPPSWQFEYVFEIAQLSDSKLNSCCPGWGSLKEKKQGPKIQGYFPYKTTIPFTFPSRFFLLRPHQAINFSPNLEVMYHGLNLSPSEAAIPSTLTSTYLIMRPSNLSPANHPFFKQRQIYFSPDCHTVS